MSGPNGTITIDGSRRLALEGEKEDATYAESACSKEDATFAENRDIFAWKLLTCRYPERTR